MKANFKVQHDVLSGLKYLQLVKRKGIRVSKDEEMIVSKSYLQTLEPRVGPDVGDIGFVSSKHGGEAYL